MTDYIQQDSQNQNIFAIENQENSMQYLANCEIFLKARDNTIYFVLNIIFFVSFKAWKKWLLLVHPAILEMFLIISWVLRLFQMHVHILRKSGSLE